MPLGLAPTTTMSVFLDNMHGKQGNIGLADGSVQQFTRSKFQECAEKTPEIPARRQAPVLCLLASTAFSSRKLLL